MPRHVLTDRERSKGSRESVASKRRGQWIEREISLRTHGRELSLIERAVLAQKLSDEYGQMFGPLSPAEVMGAFAHDPREAELQTSDLIPPARTLAQIAREPTRFTPSTWLFSPEPPAPFEDERTAAWRRYSQKWSAAHGDVPTSRPRPTPGPRDDGTIGFELHRLAAKRPILRGSR